jgi:uncharacterized LabA/DUF88 family protein
LIAAPSRRSAIAFVDGQNLFHAAREAFGYRFPNFDVVALARAVCEHRGWHVTQVRFYTGVPDETDNPFWYRFWTAKGAAMGRKGVAVYTRRLRYRNRQIVLPDGTTHTVLLGEEKGIDVRIALDVIRLAHRRAYDVGMLFSQDKDLSEVASEIRLIAREHRRWIKLACAFPVSSTSTNTRGVDGTDWIPIDRATYDQCLDPGDYRPRSR